jgi:hypothetical protein
LVASLAFSAGANATHVQSQGELTYVGTGGSGQGLYVAITGPLAALTSSCTGPYLLMATNATQYHEAFSLALTAMSHGIPVVVTYDNATCSPDGNAVLEAIAMASTATG